MPSTASSITSQPGSHVSAPGAAETAESAEGAVSAGAAETAREAASPSSLVRDLNRLAPLGVAMLGFFVGALDAQIVNVALAEMGAALGGGLSGLQWVVTGYTLTFSSLLLFAGTLSDRIGARRGYGLGMGIFVLASAVCGFAPTLPTLVAARIAQGVGAALITPTSLALIRVAYEDARERAKAVAYWALGG